ncbi:MAG TPA: hypothetical protein PKV71_03455 [Calditrichia bacterium]|nr:hypothetical protein [Calditrichota bacterium]HQU72509.1 hypothetical protein [Calditrichia bacterium]HQV30902.1 hypothetical protein [Calditrichia bacterium]
MMNPFTAVEIPDVTGSMPDWRFADGFIIGGAGEKLTLKGENFSAFTNFYGPLYVPIITSTIAPEAFI